MKQIELGNHLITSSIQKKTSRFGYQERKAETNEVYLFWPP